MRLALALALCLLPAEALAYCRTTTARVRPQPGECATSGIPIQWRNRCTGFSLFATGVPADVAQPDLERIAAESAGAWANVACDDNGREPQYFRIVPNADTLNPSGYDPDGPNSNTVSFRHRWNDDATHRPGAIAITIAFFDTLTGEIFDADIELNTFDERTNFDGFTFSTARITDPASADLQTILTHEFGHFLGLAHSDSDRAVMWWQAGLGEARRVITSDDAAGVCAIYPEHLTPDQRCIGLPYGGLAVVPGGPQVKGRGCSAVPVPASSPAAFAAVAFGLCVALRRRRRTVNAH
ncbi:MAG: matrixin family metalloprotease [Polyangiales bacterium]